jgi:glutaredoxin-like YruB-family protein
VHLEVAMDKKVTVYSTPTCPFCVRAKQYLKDNNIQFEDIDVSENHEKAQEMIKKSGQMGVPVLEIDGTIIVGFDKEKIKETLGIK